MLAAVERRADRGMVGTEREQRERRPADAVGVPPLLPRRVVLLVDEAAERRQRGLLVLEAVAPLRRLLLQTLLARYSALQNAMYGVLCGRACWRRAPPRERRG